MSRYTRNIGVKTEVYEELEQMKSPGQSFTGVIQELINKAQKFDKTKTLAQMENKKDLEKTLNETCQTDIKIKELSTQK